MSITNYAICENCNEGIELGKAHYLSYLEPSTTLPLIKERVNEVLSGRIFEMEESKVFPMLQIVAFMLVHNGHHVRIEAEGGSYLEGVGLSEDNKWEDGTIYGKFKEIE